MTRLFLKLKDHQRVKIRLYEQETVKDEKGFFVGKPIFIEGRVTDVDERSEVKAVEITGDAGAVQWVPVKSISRVFL